MAQSHTYTHTLRSHPHTQPPPTGSEENLANDVLGKLWAHARRAPEPASLGFQTSGNLGALDVQLLLSEGHLGWPRGRWSGMMGDLSSNSSNGPAQVPHASLQG